MLAHIKPAFTTVSYGLKDSMLIVYLPNENFLQHPARFVNKTQTCVATRIISIIGWILQTESKSLALQSPFSRFSM